MFYFQGGGLRLASENIHAGHRQRLLESYCSAGLSGLSHVETLELLLTFAIPRRDVNELAHRLLDRFGSFHNVLETPIDALQQVEGMTRRAAVLLQLIPEVWGMYDVSRNELHMVCDSTEAWSRALLPRFRGAREECAWLLCLDAKYKYLDCKQLSVGSVNSLSMSVRRVVETAMAVNASVVVLAHNHTSGVALPSREDVETTRRLDAALKLVDVYLADHLIVANEDFVSLRESGYLRG